jgi:hypothetical protein
MRSLLLCFPKMASSQVRSLYVFSGGWPMSSYAYASGTSSRSLCRGTSVGWGGTLCISANLRATCKMTRFFVCASERAGGMLRRARQAGPTPQFLCSVGKGTNSGLGDTWLAWLAWLARVWREAAKRCRAAHLNWGEAPGETQRNSREKQ